MSLFLSVSGGLFWGAVSVWATIRILQRVTCSHEWHWMTRTDIHNRETGQYISTEEHQQCRHCKWTRKVSNPKDFEEPEG